MLDRHELADVQGIGKELIMNAWTGPPERDNPESTRPDSRHVTASAIVFDVAQGRVLLVHHRLSGLWQFPGGHLDPGETADTAAFREVREETGIIAIPWKGDAVRHVQPVGCLLAHPVPFSIAEYPAPADPSWNEPAHTHIDFLYVGHVVGPTDVRTQDDEVAGAVWADVRGLQREPQYRIRPDVPGLALAAWTGRP